MKKVLVTARSFGEVVKIGKEILQDSGFDVYRVPDEERPITETSLLRIVTRERPNAIVVGAEPISGKILAVAKELRIVAKHGVGVDNIDLAVATEQGVVVTNAPGTNTHAVADLTMALILALSRSLCWANQSTKSGNWTRFIGHELSGKNLGVIGTGYIGKEVVKRARGFGVNVYLYDVATDTDFAFKYGAQYVPLERLLAESDYVTLHVPLIEQTRNMIGEKELKLMKKSAYLVNTSRGGIVDEEALYRHLSNGDIAGAALDVFVTEPPEESALLKLDNVLTTPHMGGRTTESAERMGSVCAENIVKLFRGESPQHVVNPKALETCVRMIRAEDNHA